MPSPVRRTSTSTKAPNCVKGYACKRACINRNRQCLSPLDGQARSYGEWLQNAVDTGAALSPQHQREVSSRGLMPTPPPTLPVPTPTSPPNPASTQSPGRTLPAGVSVSTDSTYYADSEVYSFQVGGKKIDVQFAKDEWSSGISVGFGINGRHDMTSKDDLTPEERGQISKKIKSVLDYYVATMGDGTLECNAYQDDGAAEYRAYAYEKMGFSRPVNGRPGNVQFAVVKDGKIDPDATRQQLHDTEGSRFDVAEGDKRWYGDPGQSDEARRLGVVGRLRQRRAADRDARRNQAQAQVPQRATTGATDLPSHVQRFDRNGVISYGFQAGARSVALKIKSLGAHEYISFEVDGRYDADRDSLNEQESAEISRTLRSVLRHHAAQMGSGSLIGSAYDGDGEADYRAYAYEVMGFSRPQWGAAGGNQYAVIRDGKIDPEASQAEVRKAEDDTVPGFSARSDRLWYGNPTANSEDERLGAVGRLQRQRRADRAMRRQSPPDIQF